MSLDGKHALVTGGGSGVGAAVALALAENGAHVTICGRRGEALAETAARHSSIDTHVCDVTDADAVKAMFADIARRNGPLNIIVANAGAATSQPFAKMDSSALRAIIDVNLIGVFNVWQAALLPMQTIGGGRMIAIASLAGLKGYPYVAGYVAAKHAVVGLTRALAVELATSGITVNAICPGFVETPMLEQSIATIMHKTGRTREQAATALMAGNPQKRFIQPTEIAAMVLWLTSDAAASINGQALAISGGEA
jgi:3-hydroxybutyrate dehydrogenase